MPGLCGPADVRAQLRHVRANRPEYKTLPNSRLRFIWRHSARQQVLLCTLSGSVLLLTAVPMVLQRPIVNLVTEGGTLATLAVLCSLYFLVVLAQGGLKFAMNILHGRVGEQAVRNLRNRIRRGTGATQRIEILRDIGDDVVEDAGVDEDGRSAPSWRSFPDSSGSIRHGESSSPIFEPPRTRG